MRFRRGRKRQFLRHLNLDVLTFLEPSALRKRRCVRQQLQLDVVRPKKLQLACLKLTLRGRHKQPFVHPVC
jgi:hypothetical protein